jgi:4'-phosphopantetheinyl transferase
LARQALEICAKKSQIQLGALVKDTKGVPQPFDNHYWSLTHKPKYVGAIIALQPTGIDVEEIKSISNAMFKRIAKGSEWQLGADRSEKLFFRYWTAKEAVLKAEGLGMAGLSQCRIKCINDPNHLEVLCQDKPYLIEHFYFDGHIASVVQNHLESRWTIQQA